MPTSLVTGGAGFIGSHLADELLARGHSVVVLDDLSGGARENVPAGAQLVQGSIVDDALLARLFAGHAFDYVFHLAAYAAEGLSHFIRRFNYENNLIGSVNLINLAVQHEVRRFVFTSSIAVYGRNQLPMLEETPPRPEDPYGIAKYAVELDLRAAHEQWGLDFIIFRPHNVYGERQNVGDRYRNVIGIFMNQILRGEPLTVFGDGTQTRAFTHVADVAPVIARSIEVEAARNELFNVGADQPCSVNDLARIVARTMGAAPRIDHQPARNEVQHAWAAHEKARRVFGSTEEIPLEEGIRRMATWVRQAGARETPRFTAIEIERGLPPSWR
ncbi:MAG TPA: NAD-dependent epimerase/dehydratase family protein [Thermoanaerobaculia bacterium]|nr:NAD-dependent epimerase/dehydratase family protein [Thermoanaerobaculia bacterium]